LFLPLWLSLADDVVYATPTEVSASRRGKGIRDLVWGRGLDQGLAKLARINRGWRETDIDDRHITKEERERCG